MPDPRPVSGDAGPVPQLPPRPLAGSGPARVSWTTPAVIAAGGALGALARHGIGRSFAAAPGHFPWAIFAVNVSGCLLIGMLMVGVTEAWRPHPLVRPFLGTGVLGGYTTFSTYAVDVQLALDTGAARTGLAYLTGTLAAALAAVWAGTRLARLLTRRRP